jgi:hypothetical protein
MSFREYLESPMNEAKTKIAIHGISHKYYNTVKSLNKIGVKTELAHILRLGDSVLFDNKDKPKVEEWMLSIDIKEEPEFYLTNVRPTDSFQKWATI